jgi:hypothetical protein
MPLARRHLLALAPLALFVACATPPDRPRFAGRLSAAAELPPNTTAGTGAIRVAYDPANRVMSYELSFANLSGPAIAAHFHAPAGAGEAAGIRLALAGVATSPGPLTGQVGLTPEEAADLLAGRWYVNIHTPRYPDGEIRAQLLPE